MISIIIPVYKTELYLRKCLDSVCGQSYPALEIIAVNDGSPDNSKEILDEYREKDHRVQIIDKENGGLSSARNAGLDLATGEYVLFLDSDDWMDTNTCENAVNAAEAEHADIVMWSYFREYPDCSKIALLYGPQKQVFHAEEADFPYRRIVGPIGDEMKSPEQVDRAVTAWGKLYRRNVIGDSRFVDTKLIGTEDCLFNVQVFSSAKRVVYLPNAMNHYRKDNVNSLTFNYDPKLVDRWKENYRRIQMHLTQTDASEVYFEALSHRICFGLIGLGVRLTTDVHLSRKEQQQELRRILTLEQYRNSLAELDSSVMALHWKLFFFAAKHRCIWLMMVLLDIMRWLRGRRS